MGGARPARRPSQKLQPRSFAATDGQGDARLSASHRAGGNGEEQDVNANEFKDSVRSANAENGVSEGEFERLAADYRTMTGGFGGGLVVYALSSWMSGEGYAELDVSLRQSKSYDDYKGMGGQ
jgi:hypothetical protein